MERLRTGAAGGWQVGQGQVGDVLCSVSVIAWDIRDNHAIDHVMITEGVMLTMNDRAAIRAAYSVEQHSIRQIARDLNVSRQSIRKALDDAEPVSYTLTTPRAAPKLDGYRERIQELLHQNDHVPRKQRSTAFSTSSSARASPAAPPPGHLPAPDFDPGQDA